MSRQGGQSTIAQSILRRDLLRAGSLGALGLGLPDLLRAELGSAATGDAPVARSKADGKRARACILFFLEGGPAHQDCGT